MSPDGYVITSAFNFANKPSKIFVRVPGRTERYIGELQATDHTRMVTLLKMVDAPKDFPVAVADLDGPTLAVAARIGGVRLIDNIPLEGGSR